MRRNGPGLLRWVSLGFIAAAIGLFFFELISYSRVRAQLPTGLTVAGVPVGGVDRNVALERLLQTYSRPVELVYGDQVILVSPASISFRLDTEGMLAEAELNRTGTDFWVGFWDFLWSRKASTTSVPMRSEYSSSALLDVLGDIAARYDQAPIPAQPIPGRSSFTPGLPGRVLDINRAAELVGSMLNQPSNRRVVLPVVSSGAVRPSLDTLETLLKQILNVAGFDGAMVAYINELRTGDELHFTYYQGRDLELQPDIAFTASSTIKIPIMLTYYRYFDPPFDEEAARWMTETITLSGNDPPDWLMTRLDPQRGPLIVSQTMEELGFQSTFMAGYFYLGAPLLKVYRTPGNTRSDINPDPDIYNQTTAGEMGMLLADIYACAEGGGNLMAAFPGAFTRQECDEMLNLLSNNKLGYLIEAGVPEGTRVAHKHGWPDSPFDTLADAGIVYSIGGDYVTVIFLWNQQEMIWDPTARLFADLNRAIYNFFNPPVAPLDGSGG